MADNIDQATAAGILELRAAPPSDEKLSYEKASDVDSQVVDPNDAYLEKGDRASDAASDTVFVNGEPVIRTGEDVSRYAVDVRDDGDPALTFRSIVLGTVFAGLSAALGQVRAFVPRPPRPRC